MAVKTDYTFTYRNISDRKRKNFSMLDCIRKKDVVSRTDISKETGVNIVSVSNYISNHIKKHLVVECGRDISTGGRRPELVRLNLEGAYVVGVDIGSEKIKACVVGLNLKQKAKVEITRPEGNMDKVVEGAISVIEKVLKESSIKTNLIQMIGIGASGVVDILTGVIRDTNPERGRTKTNLFSMARAVETKFNIPTLVGNDATCAAFGEISMGPGSGIQDLLFIYGDVGCGIIINGDIYCGASGTAGEIQLQFSKNNLTGGTNEETAAYGVRGADLGIVQKAKDMIEGGAKTEMLALAGKKKDAITKDIIFSASEKGDQLAKEILLDAAFWLGVKVAYLINIFNPQIVAIGGGMEKAGSIFMDSLINYAKMYSYEESFDVAKIMPSFLQEDAVSLGAAALSVRELFLNA